MGARRGSKCSPKNVSLDVVNNGSSIDIAKSTRSRWRAGVLIGVHLFIGAHIVLWLIMGSTLAPIEPSESMMTLELGIVNVGFIFFVVALLSTLLFGRYFCGWGCHMVGLQDWCASIMKKMGVRPKPFRSRLLIFVPLILALYMFVWPNFKRSVLFPILGDNVPYFLKPVPQIHRFETEFFVEDFWATFADWYIAIPTLLFCGFATVYFLGSKAFCTYGCPYGGFFAPADQFGIGRIRVNDNCEGCGHCTATCTSNVRVHEEVRDFGMVVDPGCMKCMDCVSVCPNEALSFGFGTPPIFAKPKDDAARERAKKAKRSRQKRYDLAIWEEAVIGVVFFIFFFAFRQAFYALPMLFAVGIAGVGSFLTWTFWSMLIRPNVSLQNLRLKTKGRMRRSGWIVATLTVPVLVFTGWAAYVRYHLWQGNLAYAQLDVPLGTALRREYVPTDRTSALAADMIRHYGIMQKPADGGIGYGLEPDRVLNLAYAHVLLGQSDEAIALLRRRIETGKPIDNLVFQLGDLMLWSGQREQDVIDMYAWAAELHPSLNGARSRAAAAYAGASRLDEAKQMWEDALDNAGDDAGTYYGGAYFFININRERGIELLNQASRMKADPSVRLAIANLFFRLDRRDDAEASIEQLLDDHHTSGQQRIQGAFMLSGLGKEDRALEVLGKTASRAGTDGMLLVAVAEAYAQLDKPDTAERVAANALSVSDGDPNVALQVSRIRTMLGGQPTPNDVYEKMLADPSLSPWDRLSVAFSIMQIGLQSDNAELRELAIAAYESTAAANPGSPTIQHDLGVAYFTLGETEKGLASLTAAAEAGSDNPMLAQRVADALESLARTDEATRWKTEARRRAQERR